jgi:uncharacterized protein (TIGR01619 family)
MPEDWKQYFCNVNGHIASILLNLALRTEAPMPGKPNLLWVWVHCKTPRADGLSDSTEAETLWKIEDGLVEELASGFGAILAGKITTQGRREFYFYTQSCQDFELSVSAVLRHFPGYRFNCGMKEDVQWDQYFNVLYPPEEELQKMKNLDVLELLKRQGDGLTAVRELTHWAYFETSEERDQFERAVDRLGYRRRGYCEGKNPLPFGLTVFREQLLLAEAIDSAVIELFRLARTYRGDYDGWETQVVSSSDAAKTVQ